MTGEPSLTRDEWALLMELLERERYELPAEIHHTRTSQVRDELKERLALVDRLLRRLREHAAQARQAPAEPGSVAPSFPGATTGAGATAERKSPG